MLESSIRTEVQNHLEAAKVEHKKKLDKFQNELDQKFEILRVETANLSHKKDPILKASLVRYRETPINSLKEDIYQYE